MSEKAKSSVSLEEAASRLVLRELTDIEASDIFGGQKADWGRVTVGPATPAA
ncbi:hypothetical protein [Dyella mobilis]|uniref:Uncharacterized protein n=1 Tax=Dyella mobilis TaxID=1849582 RepID=A0ABS2KMS6_9GAMM|nr:hypothetical protein [Dyella mobilis]MBM7132265.1 hypothetical protein [Dyella mobilis]GLQ95750.1 hypothetical protein GCM10007863_01680 [Dyella mobilis]